MTEAGNHYPINRVFIALDALKENDNTLEFAVALAASKQAELMMLFVEDLDLVHLASLPFASEIDRMSTLERKLDSLQMSRTFRAQTQRLEKILERISQQKHVNYSLKVVRGHYLQEALLATNPLDVLFLCKTIGRYGKRTSELNPLKKISYINTSFKNAVWIIYQGTAASNHALLMASDLAVAANKELVIIIRAAQDNANQHKQQAISILASQPISTHYVIAPLETGDKDLINLMKGKECELLVLPNDEQPTINHQVFLDELERPVMLVR